MWSFSTKQPVNSTAAVLCVVVKVKLRKTSREGASSLIFANHFHCAVDRRSVANGAPLMASSTPRLSQFPTETKNAKNFYTRENFFYITETNAKNFYTRENLFYVTETSSHLKAVFIRSNLKSSTWNECRSGRPVSTRPHFASSRTTRGFI